MNNNKLDEYGLNPTSQNGRSYLTERTEEVIETDRNPDRASIATTSTFRTIDLTVARGKWLKQSAYASGRRLS